MTDEEFNEKYNMDKMQEDYSSHIENLKEITKYIKTLSSEEKETFFESESFKGMMESSYSLRSEVDKLADNMEKINNKD